MSKFISRKQLEVHHSKTYEMRGRLKQLGCEWDAAARAWIAPTLEVKELCYQILEEAELQCDSIRTPYFGRCGAASEKLPETWEEMLSAHGAVTEEAKSIAYTPSKDDAIKIVGEENVLRYWNERIPSEAAEILASGEINQSSSYEYLKECGWTSRSISLLWDIVNHFRNYPPIPAVDEKLDVPILKPSPTVKPEDMQGSIGVICDQDGQPAYLTVKFPYDPRKVALVKWCPGRRWNGSLKRWEVPIESKKDVFLSFPHFQRSPLAIDLEISLKNEQ